MNIMRRTVRRRRHLDDSAVSRLVRQETTYRNTGPFTVVPLADNQALLATAADRRQQ